MISASAKIEAALAEIRKQLEAAVRDEQLRDQLTGLRNNLALAAAIEQALEKNTPFWCAFLEVDYFKRLNDKFSYDVADSMLIKIAKRLEHFEDYVAGAVAVRAHGDEFYLFGSFRTGSESHLHESIDRAREEIAGLRVPTQKDDMNCTVSVGWMTSADGGDTVLTLRAVLGMLEAAVAAAKKRGRNQVIRYNPEVEKAQRQSLRDDCLGCTASFTVEVPLDTPHLGDLKCPNCGQACKRPPMGKPGVVAHALDSKTATPIAKA